MADASAIGLVSQSLQAVLRAAITDSGAFPGTAVDLQSPRELLANGAQPTVVSLWLYRVKRNEDLVNAPPVRLPNGRVSARPLPLDLYYLVTPLAPQALTRQRLMGRAMQALHDASRFGAEFLRAELLAAGQSGLSVHLEPQTLDEATKVWHALHQPYELSVTYVAQVCLIESLDRPVEGPPVLDKADRYAIIEAVT